MQELTEHANQSVNQLSQRYGVSTDAVRTLLQAVSAGGGTMAQFYHSELGGGGQWMQGGMTMVGDMFNHGLQATVSGLCSELSSLLASGPVYVPIARPAGGGSGGFSSFNGGYNNWWPSELGSPSSSGGQHDSQYAYFPQARRLAVKFAGQVTVYDTLDHQIGGVQQQQSGGPGSQSFSSQRGTFTVDSLPLVSRVGPDGQLQPIAAPPPPPQYAPAFNQAPAFNPAPAFNQAPAARSGGYDADSGNPQGQTEIFAALDRLGDLHHRGILSDDEFRTKKAELLSRL
ncbi:MAG: SHOCT domain-containing protein [Polyangiales bacterium]